MTNDDRDPGYFDGPGSPLHGRMLAQERAQAAQEERRKADERERARLDGERLREQRRREQGIGLRAPDPPAVQRRCAKRGCGLVQEFHSDPSRKQTHAEQAELAGGRLDVSEDGTISTYWCSARCAPPLEPTKEIPR